MRALSAPIFPGLSVLVLSSLTALGQGSGVVGFSSAGTAADNRVYVTENPETPYMSGVPAAGSAYNIAFFWSEPLAGNTNWAQIGAPIAFLTGNGAGQWLGGSRTITGLSVPGAVIDIYAKAWETAFGSSYEIASQHPYARFGQSGIVTIKTKDPAGGLETTPTLTSHLQWNGFALFPRLKFPEIVPNSQTQSIGNTITFSVLITNLSEFSLQWQLNGIDLTGETNTTLTITNAQPSSAGVYRVIVTIPEDQFPSHSATLTLLYRTVEISVAEGPGSVTKSPDKEHYDTGEAVTLAATPGRWHRFERWDDGSTDNPRVITVASNGNQFAAYFAPTTILETVTINGVTRTAPKGMPIILVNGQFITDAAVTNAGPAEVVLQTTLANGILLFSRDGTQPNLLSSLLYTGPFQVRRSATIWPVAYSSDFSQSIEGEPLDLTIIPLYQLLASTAGGGQIQVNPNSSAFVSNSLVTLTAVAEPGWNFLGWQGDASGASETTQLTITRDHCVQAIFGTSLSANVSGSGTVAISPEAASYPFGTRIQCFGTPEPGHFLAFWSTSGVHTNNPLELNVTDPTLTVSAAFQQLAQGQVSLAVSNDGFGEVVMSPSGNRFPSRQRVTLTAVPAAFQQFIRWSDDLLGAQNPVTITLSQSRLITAYFTRAPVLRPDACGSAGLERPRFLLHGELGGAYIIERSTNLSGWEPILKLTNVLGTASWNTDGFRPEYFRALSE